MVTLVVFGSISRTCHMQPISSKATEKDTFALAWQSYWPLLALIETSESNRRTCTVKFSLADCAPLLSMSLPWLALRMLPEEVWMKLRKSPFF